METKLNKIWIDDNGYSGTELRLDFDNDRHYALEMNEGDTRDVIRGRLIQLARAIGIDEGLNR